MFQDCLKLILGSIAVCAVLLIVENLFRTNANCLVVITGESITYRNCVFNKEFVDFALSVKSINNNLS